MKSVSNGHEFISGTVVSARCRKGKLLVTIECDPAEYGYFVREYLNIVRSTRPEVTSAALLADIDQGAK